MKRILSFVLLVVVISANKSNAQNRPFQALHKGDKVPNLAFTVWTGDTKQLVHLDDYKGKLLLLDFWGVHCPTCLALMPKMLELQKQFKDKIQVLYVTSDKDEDIQKLWNGFLKRDKTNKWVEAGKQLPFVKEDTILSTLFPHRVEPTHVWVDGNQVVRGIAYHGSTTAENIEAFIEGKDVELAEQQLNDLNMDDPLSWIDPNKGMGVPQYYSFFADFIDIGVGGGMRSRNVVDSSTQKVVGISCVDNSILNLYKLAYKEWILPRPYIPDNRIIIESKDTIRLFMPQDQSTVFQWIADNTFCYALKVPPSLSSQLYVTMRVDLDRFFGMKSDIEKRKVKCWVIKRISTDNRILSRSLIEKYEVESGKLIIQKLKIEQIGLENVFDVQYPSRPFIDETNYKSNVDMELPWNEIVDKISIPRLKKALQNYGFDIVEEYRNIDMLVIRDGKPDTK